MATIKFKHVNSYFDERLGRTVHQCRPPGYRSKFLTGNPESDEFRAEYNDWMEQAGITPAEPKRFTDIGSGRAVAGSADAIVAAYKKDDAFTKDLSQATQDMRRPILDRFCNMVGKDGRRYGDRQLAGLRRRHINQMMQGMTRDAKKNFMKALRGLTAYAVGEELINDDPCIGIRIKSGPKSQGHMTWLEPQVEKYRKHHALGTNARLALELLLNIAARRWDAHEIGEGNIVLSNQDGKRKLCWRPHKTLRSTGKMLKIRIMPSLQAAIDAMPKRDTRPVKNGTVQSLPFILNDYGNAFASAAAFGNKFANWCDEAGLLPVKCADGRTRNFRAHGLRKASLRTLAHAGCTHSEMMAVSGHASERQLLEYLEEIEQEFMADKAMDKLAAAEDEKRTKATADLL